MPSTHGFEFLVEGADGVPFATYDTRPLGRRIITTKIQAKTGVRFNIRVRPHLPFPEANDASPDEGRYNMRPSTRPAQVAGEGDAKPSRAAAKPEDEFHYVAFVYLDGKKKAESTCNLVVDPKDSRYHEEGYLMVGRFSLADDSATQNRSDQDLEASMSVSPWVFSERGIDVLMGRMDISRADPDIPSTAMERDLVDLTQAMGNDNLRGGANAKRGQIEIKIVRVVPDGEIRPNQYWKRDEEETPKNNDDRTHDVIIDKDQEHRISMISTKYRRYRPDEAFLCKAIFQYMDIAKLVSLGLCNVKGEAIDRRQKNAIGSPLSILPSGRGPQRGQLKRLISLKREQGEHGGLEMAKSLSSNDEESASDTTSDSDVPRRKRRAGIRGRKAMALKEKKTLQERETATLNPSTSNLSLVPNKQDSGTEEANAHLQLVQADIGGDHVEAQGVE
ncbi:hypothetical protein AYL99_01638 [Fonsecaea erecta]|uniref:Uncharacterized protein n=1 Tax=Fonsecaea erecta TaxID=1367422 RepID=A0A179A2B1_9EURO|nr:hypothetical protein AYL99_01638 [Fonsecaea erecta]OAP65666.1 hypothetical protein AYL99_01638 [Fonsecaea erecta]